VAYLQDCAAQQLPVEGWQVDDITRNFIKEAGYGDHFIHRTGHSLSPGDMVHGAGVNLDNLESHDTRRLRPGIGFTIEPGIYLPEFGVRLEINLYMDQTGPRITTPVQQEIICLDV
jgi:Xaa-Pro aminopeptidase